MSNNTYSNGRYPLKLTTRVIVNCRAGHCSSGRHSSLHLGIRHQEKKKKKTEQRAEQRRRQRGESSGAGDTQHPHFQAEIPGQSALNLQIYLFQKPNKCICKYCIKSIWEKIFFSSFFVLRVLQRVSPNYFRKTIFYKS